VSKAGQKLKDSLIAADREYQNMVHHDSINGWTTIRFPLSVPEAMPTNIVVYPGDSVDIVAEGTMAMFVKRRDGLWGPWEPHLLSPDGMWPIWMTVPVYREHFAETNSRKCWNLCFRLGENTNAPLVPIGQKVTYHMIASGDIWLKINKVAKEYAASLDDSLSGEFIVKIRVTHPPVDSGVVDTNVADPAFQSRVDQDGKGAFANQPRYSDWQTVFEGQIPVDMLEPIVTNVRYDVLDSLSIVFGGERMFLCPMGAVTAKGCGTRPYWLASTEGFPAAKSPPFAVVIGIGDGRVALREGNDRGFYVGKTFGGDISIINNAPRNWCAGNGTTMVELKIKKVI
jgi:hypothetical protein